MTDPTKGFLEGAKALVKLIRKASRQGTIYMPEAVQTFYLIQATRADLDGFQIGLAESMKVLPRPVLEDHFRQLQAFYEGMGLSKSELALRLALLETVKELVND
ncbi:MAG: hypothetical protein OXH10_09780 [bacterium]|nr:hypothetical protein [bacterium]MCY3580689.1 hypothetical protein [bacterium]MCY3652147.1 hypothetical protein [bacterium]MXX63682.1 hypothetical protein [Acidimicrobiia bacterium]